MKVGTMTKKTNAKGNLLDVKWLILSGSLAATLGLWGVFAKADSLKASQSAGSDPNANPGAGGPAETAGNNTLALELPPMPTLIPAATGVASLLSAPASATTSFGAAAPATGQKPVKIFLGGGKPGSQSALPLTRTSSSR
jgi:hypothetical protein